MKTPQRLTLVLACLALGAGLPLLHAEDSGKAYADKKGPGAQDDQGSRMKEELGLTDDQATKIKAIRENTMAQMKALREQEGEPSTKMAQMKAIQQESKAKIDALLSPEQKVKADKMREQMQARMKERAQGEAGAPGQEKAPGQQHAPGLQRAPGQLKKEGEGDKCPKCEHGGDKPGGGSGKK